MLNIIAFIFVFGLLVLVHELGHLIFAKRAGILCREFAIGFGPKIVSFMYKETRYTIRLLPIGGFVRMAGEDPEHVEIKRGQEIGLTFGTQGEVTQIITGSFERYRELELVEVVSMDLERELFITGIVTGGEEQTFRVAPNAMIVDDKEEVQIAPIDRQFQSKSVGARSMAIIAGPLFNFLLAFVLFIIIALGQGIPTNENRLGDVIPSSVAEKAGFQKDDVIVSIDGQPVKSWDEVTSVIRKNPNESLSFVVDRNGTQQTIEATPEAKDNNGEKIGAIGVYAPMEKSFVASVKYGFTETYTWIVQTIGGFVGLLTGQFGFDALSGPLGIYNYTGEIAQSGFMNLLKWTAVLSINLGIINLVPLPALDGGRLLFFAFEAVRGRPIDPKKESFVHFVGFALLMLLMIVVTWNDIKKFFL
ncbi:MAG: RIP metalloprotease RseP [Bacilli bacterium]